MIKGKQSIAFEVSPYLEESASVVGKKEGVCDVCGGELTQRSDESEEAVQVRIDTYNKQTKPLIDYYTMLGELTNVDGNQSMDEVAEEIYKVLDELK